MTSREAKKKLNKEKLTKIVDNLRKAIISTFNSNNDTNLQFDIKDREPQFKSDYLRYDFTLATFESYFDEGEDARVYSDVLRKNSTLADDFELDVIDPSIKSLKKIAQSMNTKAYITSTLNSMNGHWYITYVVQIRIPYDLILNESVKENMIKNINNIEEDIETHDTLNPKLWDENETLKDEIKDKLLKVVDECIKDSEQENIKLDIKDIILVGSNCSYNYTKDSDIDLHIVADTAKNNCTKNHLEIIYDLFKSSFNDKYDITIKGIPVELYIENDETTVNSNGIYSLYNGWIKQPTKEAIPNIDYDSINKNVDSYVNRYNELLKELGYDDAKLEESLRLNEMKDKEIIHDKKILDLIHNCIDDVRSLGYEINDDIYFTYGDALGTFGTLIHPYYEGGWWTLVLNKFMINEPEEALKSTIYHELAHYVNDKELINEGVFFWRGDTLYRLNSKYKSSLHSSHGKCWKEIANKISSSFGVKINPTDRYETHKDVGARRDEKVKYIVRCKNCGNEYPFLRKTEFVKSPNLSLYDGLVKKYGLGAVEKFYSEDKKREMKSKHYWGCNKCGKADFEVEER